MKLVVRADATAETATGHLMRCLALGQAWKDAGGTAVFVTRTESKKLLEKIKREFRVYPLPNAESKAGMVKILAGENPDWVALDGYHFDGGFQKEIKEAGFRLLYIDDYAPFEHYYADIILNQNFGAEKLEYSTGPDTRVLAGTRYVLLRREFLVYSGFRRKTPEAAGKILVTMGGADSENHTSKVLRALESVKGPLEAKIVIGAGNPHYESVAREAARHGIEILRSVEDMAPLMAWADLAVSAGGSTVWELAFMGLPALVAIVAGNQEKPVNLLGENGICQSCGWIRDKSARELAGMIDGLIHDGDLRLEMSKKARRMVDGKGAARVIKEMGLNEPDEIAVLLKGDFETASLKLINFINLSREEKKMVLEWRNSPRVRRWMFNSSPITEDEHFAFIERLKKDGRNFYWMAERNGEPCGVVSFQGMDRRRKTASIGIYSVKKGSGRFMMQGLIDLRKDMKGMDVLQAEVLSDNVRAREFFRSFGFEEDGETRSIDGSRKAISMSLEKRYGRGKGKKTK